MMLVIIKRIVPGRTLGGLGVVTQRYFKSRWPINHIGAVHRVENEFFFVPKMYINLIVHSVFDHNDPHKRALDCC